MINSTIAKLHKNIDKIVKFLEPRDFINCHMVAYLCDDLWNKFIPLSIRNEIQTNEDVDSAIALFFDQEGATPELIKKHQNLFNHIEKTKTFYLENLEDKFFVTGDELKEIFKELDIPEVPGLNLSIKEFMKDKKGHEVETVARVIASLSKARDRQHLVIDVGDGLGYLSSRLNLEYQLKVLGIDGNQNNSEGATKRNQRLSKQWKALVSKEAKKKNVEVSLDDVAPKHIEFYKTTSKMIFADTNLEDLVAEAFPDESCDDLCLVGLHTCGNLAATSLKQFVKNDSMKLLCNVGCCYHLLFEEFEDDFFNDELRVMDPLDSPGFPMSCFLREKKYKLGRNGRMLAAQCFERVIASQDMPDDSLFYRALFEKILREEKYFKNVPQKVLKLGRIKYKNFEEYLSKGCLKYGIESTLTTEDMEKLLKDFEHERRLINLNYFIRLLNAKVIETLILLDRYLFLLENKIDHVFLVRLFDPVISPRNYGFIGIKN